MNFLCKNCKNSVPAGSKLCPYCMAPQPQTIAGRRAKLVLLAFAVFLLFATIAFLKVRATVLTSAPATEPQPPAQEQVVSSPSASDASGPAEFVAPQYKEENTLMDVYNNLLLASEHKDESRIRNSISKGGFAEIKKHDYEMMDYATSDMSFDNMKTVLQEEKNNRGLLVFTGTSSLFTDEKGNPAVATGIYQFEFEEEHWKLHSLVWHIHPRTDPVVEARRWLDQRP